MMNFLNRFKKQLAQDEKPVKKERPRQLFSTDIYQGDVQAKIEELWDKQFKNAVHPAIALDDNKKLASFAMDNQLNIKAPYANQGIIPDQQILWYASQTFIGYQLAAMLAQNWLISKCCLMPAKDATRNGYEITVNDGTDVDPEILDAIRKLDGDYKVNQNLIQFVQMGRVFGIRIAMFKVESDDPDYYKKPFNPDGVTPGSYKGISQIDPYWITPQLDAEAAGDPSSIHFYEPTWWIVSGKPIHRTHLVIFRTEEVADILKPSYIFGGIPIPQKVVQRVYASERTANEAPLLALTKRVDVIKADLTETSMNPVAVSEKLQTWVNNRDNFGVKVIGLDEEFQQFDVSLADLDAVIMTQYQLVAAAANVPATKLLGTSPKGFNTTGEFEESSYHEELESIQKHDLSALLDRHHLLLIRSEIAPQYGISPFEVTVSWNPLDAMTAKELAEINRLKVESDVMLMQTGAIDGHEIRQRITTDPESGYNGLGDKPEEDPLSILSEETGA